jgi:hypothetical protein
MRGDRYFREPSRVERTNKIDGFPETPADPDGDAAIARRFHPARATFEVRDRSGHRPRFVEQGAPFTCQLHAGPMPEEERHAQLGFELANLPGERRLRDVETLGGSREVSFVGDGDECAQMSKVHGAILL